MSTELNHIDVVDSNEASQISGGGPLDWKDPKSVALWAFTAGYRFGHDTLGPAIFG